MPYFNVMDMYNQQIVQEVLLIIDYITFMNKEQKNKYLTQI